MENNIDTKESTDNQTAVDSVELTVQDSNCITSINGGKVDGLQRCFQTFDSLLKAYQKAPDNFFHLKLMSKQGGIMLSAKQQIVKRTDD